MSEKSTGQEAPEPVGAEGDGGTAVDATAAQPSAAPAGQPAPPAYGPPPPGWRPPRKKLTEQSFTWKGLLVAAIVGLVVGGGLASGIGAIVHDHDDHVYKVKIVPGGFRHGGGFGGGLGDRGGWGRGDRGGFPGWGGQGQPGPGQQPAQPPQGAPSASPSQAPSS